MRSPLQAIAWEIWKRNVVPFLLVVGLAAGCGTIYRIFNADIRASDGLLDLCALPMGLSLILTYSNFNYTEFNRVKQWTGFPYRCFALPIRTWLLVGWPMLLGMVTVMAVYSTWSKLILGPLGRVIPLWGGIILTVGMAWYQAIIWSLAAFRITRIVVLSVGAIMLLTIALLPMMKDAEDLKRPLSVLLGGVAIAAYVAAWLCVDWQRHGGGRGRGWTKAIVDRILDVLPRRRRGFASPAAAQFWFEWRRTGWILPGCTAAVLLGIFAPFSWLTRNDFGDTTVWTFGWLLALPIILALVIGKGFMKPDFWSGEVTLPNFVAIGPLSSGDVVVTKMKVAALSVLVAWALVFGFITLWLVGWAKTVHLHDAWEDGVLFFDRSRFYAIAGLSVLALVTLTWRGLVANLWLGLAGNKKYFTALTLLDFLVIGVVVWECNGHKDFQLSQLKDYVWWTSCALTLAVIVKLSLAMYSWNEITPARIKRYLLIWSGFTLCFVALAMLVAQEITWLRRLLIMAAFLPFPLARLGLAPRMLAKNRHR